MDYQKREPVKICTFALCASNVQYLYGWLRKKLRNSPLRKFCQKAIVFYQKRLSKHTCLYHPTCSQYTLECIHNHGVVLGIAMGVWRILRCNPLSQKKGAYDPAPENAMQKRWLI